MSTIKSSDEHLTLNADGSSKDIKFQANGVEKASISSSGAFTSTTIDATKLTGALPAISGAALTGVGVAGITSTADGTAITINSTENVGIEVTPESWENNYPALQIGGAGALGGHSSGEVYLTDNVYRNGGNWKHINTGAATFYQAAAGQHRFKTAPSASADANISWSTAMTIDNNGYVTKPKNPAFKANYSSGQTGNWNGEWFIPNSTSVNVGSAYNTSNGRFYAPVAGNYFFSLYIRIDSRSGAYWYIDLLNNGTMHHRALTDVDVSYDYLSVSGVIPMAASDYVQAKINTVGDTSSEVNGESAFSGFLIG